jgi:two-component system, OmpR family, KDP operon response regulator KdpE
MMFESIAGGLAKAQHHMWPERSSESLIEGLSSKLRNTNPRAHTLFEKAIESSFQGRVLVVDDEGPPRKALRASLAANGFFVQEAGNGWEALGMLREQAFDLVLIATKLLRVSCTEACGRIRGISPQAGIVMITVGDLEDDRIHALDAGADDCVTKPFKLRELMARLRAILRRTHSQETAEPTVLRAGPLRMDLERRLVWRCEEKIHLSPKAFELLAFMMKHCGTTLTHSKLLHWVWGLEYGSEFEYLRTYVRMLRKKIEVNPAKPQYILTEPWIGYRFRDPSEPDCKDVT